MAERDTARLRGLLAGEELDVNAARADGATALLWAAHWDDGEAVDLLLGAGADVNAADDHGVTPLARACENASASMVERLLAAGANPNAAQANGLTPLMTAARTGSLDVVRALLSDGADVDATAATHETALMWAVAGRHLDVVRALVEQGADVQPQPGQAFSPLVAAAHNGDVETAELLLAAGAGVDETGSDGAHPLAYAVIVGQVAFAHFLLERGADPNGAVDGVTALHAAAGPVRTWLKAWNRKHGGAGARAGRLALGERLPLVDALLARGADPNARMTASDVTEQGFVRNGAYDTFATGTGDVAGATPLWVAAFATNPGPGRMRNGWSTHSSTADVLRRLLRAGAQPGITSNDGTTPMMAAAGCGRWGHWTNTPRAARQSDGGGGHRDSHRGRHGRERHQRERLHGVALRRLQRPERGDPTARGARRRHRRPRLAGPDGVPPRRGRQAVVPLPSVAGDGGPARGARCQYPPGDPGDRPRAPARAGGTAVDDGAGCAIEDPRRSNETSSGRLDGRDRGRNGDPRGRAEGGGPRGVRPRDEDHRRRGRRRGGGARVGVVRRGQDTPGARTTGACLHQTRVGDQQADPTPCG